MEGLEYPRRAGVGHVMTTIGIIGAGHIGGQVARAVTGLGYDVVIEFTS